MVFYWLNFQKRKKATLRTSEIILEVRRVAFLRFWKFIVNIKHSISKKLFYLFCTFVFCILQKYHNEKRGPEGGLFTFLKVYSKHSIW